MRMMTLDDFTGLVNQTFAASLQDGEMPFVLVEARSLAAGAPQDALRVPFSLLFRSTASFPLPQQIYRMRHPSLGEVDIFLVPVAREREGFLYQASFN